MLHARLAETCAECTGKCQQFRNYNALRMTAFIERAGYKWFTVVDDMVEIESYPSDEYNDVCCRYTRTMEEHAVRKTG